MAEDAQKRYRGAAADKGGQSRKETPGSGYGHQPEVTQGRSADERLRSLIPEGRMFRYRGKGHEALPHAVKFSGGRSSGMLLFKLLEGGLLDPARGDVILFNNTSAEHGATYRFVRRCREKAAQYGVPFFLIEFQTYEDARRGDWTRIPSYRLVNDRAHSASNPDGFRRRGEVFEELLSWSGYVPNRFSRSCTKHLKIETTKRFMLDWCWGGDSVPRLGHFYDESTMDADRVWKAHRAKGGKTPRKEFEERSRYCWARPHVRPEQRYTDFERAAGPARRDWAANRVPEDKPWYARTPRAEWVSLTGVRADEHGRAERIEARGPELGKGILEHVYSPLAEIGASKKDVSKYWAERDADFEVPEEPILTNCTYCFMKGSGGLKRVHEALETNCGNGAAAAGGPESLEWWRALERRYGRPAERGAPGVERIGFFGNTPSVYDELAADGAAQGIEDLYEPLMPCECTD